MILYTTRSINSISGSISFRLIIPAAKFRGAIKSGYFCKTFCQLALLIINSPLTAPVNVLSAISVPNVIFNLSVISWPYSPLPLVIPLTSFPFS